MEMVLVMKAISFSFDNEIKLDFLHYTSYMTCTGTSYFGPWIKYGEHIESQKSKRSFILKAFKSLLMSFICLVTSSCFLNIFEFTYEYSLLFKMYFEALSFRLSNYFVCFYSQAICELSGVLTTKNLSKKVTRPLYIEIPRSLIDVVTAWNIPMHEWLKQYAFKPAKLKYGTQTALFLTYTSSVLIHGLDVNIALILFSLGFYTSVEYKIRKMLSNLLSRCIETRPCKDVCLHLKKENDHLTIFINIIFLLFNIYHLAYLGQVFYSNSQVKFDTFLIWNNTYFSSHIIIIFIFFASILFN